MDVSTHSTLPTSLVSYWELEESSGTRVDSTATGNDLTDNNTVLNATGIQGNAADFESTNSESLSITDAAQSGLDITGDLSISCWVKFESTPSTGNGVGIVTKSNVTTSDSYFLALFNSSGTLYLYTQARKNTSVQVGNFAAWTPTLGTWYHLVLVYDASAGNIKVYVDGSEYASDTNASADAIQNSSIAFVIGAHSGARYFDGLIDEVGIWSKTLTTGEITDLYNSGAGIPYAGGLTQTLSETATLTDTIQKDTTRSLSESGSLADTVDTLLVQLLDLAESLSASDSTLAKITGRVLAETVTVTDTVVKSFTRLLTEAATLTVSIANTTYKALQLDEVVNLVERTLYKLNGVNALWSDIYTDTADAWSDIYNDN